MTLQDRIKTLETLITSLQAQIDELHTDKQSKTPSPTSYAGGSLTRSSIHPIDISSKKQAELGGHVIWNDTEIDGAYGQQPESPTEGYAKHTHSRYSGGALHADVLEIALYDWRGMENQHSQQFIKQPLQLQTESNSRGEAVPMIGLLDLIFDPDTVTWKVAAADIDVERCLIIKRRKEAETDIYGNPVAGKDIGDIETDENGTPMKAHLYFTKEDGTQDMEKSSVIWDKDAKCWRFFAVYSPGATP